jgi:hypothetical protein
MEGHALWCPLFLGAEPASLDFGAAGSAAPPQYD